MTLEQLQSDGYGQLPENATKMQQLQHELGQEFMKVLDNSQIGKILENYGFTADNIIKFQAVLDLHKIQQTNDAFSDQEMRSALENIPGAGLTLLSCCWVTSPIVRCVPC